MAALPEGRSRQPRSAAPCGQQRPAVTELRQRTFNGNRAATSAGHQQPPRPLSSPHTAAITSRWQGRTPGTGRPRPRAREEPSKGQAAAPTTPRRALRPGGQEDEGVGNTQRVALVGIGHVLREEIKRAPIPHLNLRVPSQPSRAREGVSTQQAYQEFECMTARAGETKINK